MWNDPMRLEFKGESFTFSSAIKNDKDGAELRLAANLIRGMTKGEFDNLLGTVTDLPDPEPHINNTAPDNQE